jgi:hypothetical protein
MPEALDMVCGRHPLWPATIETMRLEATVAEKRYCLVSKMTIRATTIGNDRSIPRKFAYSRRQLLGGDRDCAANMASLVLYNWAHIHKDHGAVCEIAHEPRLGIGLAVRARHSKLPGDLANLR